MVQLHSRYNPQAEAARYIDALNLNCNFECFILIEPGLGFLIPVLQERFKNCKIVALHAGAGFNTAKDYSVPAWNPGSALTLQDFLETEICGMETSKLRVIEWRPGLNAYGDAYINILSQTVEFIKRLDAGHRTTAVFGKKWVKNFFKNLSFLQNALLYKRTDSPIIITGAGPSLEAALPEILQIKDNALIIAASSSLMALNKGGITPDIVINTDGGSWALQHLYQCFRADNTLRGLAVSLFAALPSQCSKLPFLVLNEGSLWQNLILKELVIPSVVIPQRGTVAASALELALILSTGNIYLAGVDLSVKGLSTHSRPYGFDHLLFGCASRFSPVYSQKFWRYNTLKAAGSHDIYAAWFKNQLRHWPKRIFSLGNSHSVFENTASLSACISRSKPKNIFLKEIPVTQKTVRGVKVLLHCLENTQFSQSLNDEISPLLFPGEKKVSNGELKKAIIDCSEGYVP